MNVERRVPFAIAATLSAAGITWATHLAVSPDPFAPSSAVAIGAGIVVFTAIAAAGLLLVRAPWSRWVGLATAGTGLVVGIITGFSSLAWLAAVLSVAAIAGLSGPWLRLWLRGRRSADGPDPRATSLALATLSLLPLCGFASPEGLDPVHYATAGAAVVLAWGYARSFMWALWGIRVLIPILGVVAAWSSPLGGTVLLLTATGIITVLAWSGAAARAVHGPGPPPPAPRYRLQAREDTP